MGSAGMFFHCRVFAFFAETGQRSGFTVMSAASAFAAMSSGVHGDKLFDEAATGGGYEPQFAAVVREGRSEHARFLEQVAIEVKRRDHVAGVVCDLRDVFAVLAEGREDLHDLVDLLLLCFAQFRQLFELLHV